MSTEDLNVNSKYSIRDFEANSIFFIAVILFLFNDIVRNIVVHNKINQINIPYLLIGIVVVAYCFFRKKVDCKLFYLVSLFSTIVITQIIFTTKSYLEIVLTISTLILPLYFCCLRISKDKIISIMGKFLTVFNLLCIVLTIVGCWDYITDGSIQSILVNKVYDTEFGELILIEKSWGIYRYYSFIGHPLTNAYYFLTFFSLNNIYSRYDKAKLNKYILIIITLVGLILSGSKTALILGVFLIIFCSNIKKNKWIYYIILCLCLFIVFHSEIFKENLMKRFIDGINSGNITSGRNNLIQLLLNTRLEFPKVILGGGAGYSRIVARNLMGNIYNFEYPILMLAYDYSIIGCSIIYVIILIYPMIRIVKKKQWFLLINFISITIMLNSNNGLANFSDVRGQLGFIILILNNIVSD